MKKIEENFSEMSERDILNTLKNFDNDGGSDIDIQPVALDNIPEEQKKAVTIAIIGLPNAGKSSLMNNVVGEKLAAISSKVQTTRNAIRGIKIIDETQLIFIDSPGVIDAKNVMDKFLFDATKRTIKESELLLVLMDIRSERDENFQIIIDNIARYTHKEKILVINKIDLFEGEKLQTRLDSIQERFKDVFEQFFHISVTKEKGITNLLDFLKSKAQQRGWLYPQDQISEAPMKFFAAEITREKLFEALYLELPYSIIIETDSYKEEKDMITICQTIYVNKASHKSMIIGKGAQMIKKIGIESRVELERITGKRVNLLLHAKLKENWIKNEFFIKNIIGYTGS